MFFPVEQAFVWRDEKRVPLKTPAWEASYSSAQTVPTPYFQYDFLRKNVIHFSLTIYTLNDSTLLLCIALNSQSIEVRSPRTRKSIQKWRENPSEIR